MMKKHFQAKPKIFLVLFIVMLQTSCGNNNARVSTPTLTPTVALTSTATSRPKVLWGKQSFSPDDKWVASRYKSFKGQLPFLSFTIEKLDGSATWEIETIPIENKPPYLEFPAPFMRSKDGKTFYFVNQGSQDGCFSFTNGGKGLFSLNLANGERKTILDEFASEIKFSPDETKLAHVNYGDTGLKIVDLKTKTEVELEHLYPDMLTDQYGLVWSPDNSQLAFTILLDACGSDKATSIVVINVKDNSQKIVLREDERHIYTKEWLNEDRILVSDWSDNSWYLNPETGDLIPVDQ